MKVKPVMDALEDRGADVVLVAATPKFAAQAIRKLTEIGWKPMHFLNNVSGSIGGVIPPAGPENAEDIISSARGAMPFKPGESWVPSSRSSRI